MPLILGEPETRTLEKLGKCNGVLFPGGNDDGYYDFGKFIYEAVKAYNDAGQFYPLMGLCQGHENMAMYASSFGKDVLDVLLAINVSLPLEFIDGVEAKLFDGLGNQKHLFEEFPVTQNFHQWAIKPEQFEIDEGLSSMFYPTSISYTTDTHEPFVATMESKNYPFYAVQFHPEKPVGKFT